MPASWLSILGLLGLVLRTDTRPCGVDADTRGVDVAGGSDITAAARRTGAADAAVDRWRPRQRGRRSLSFLSAFDFVDSIDCGWLGHLQSLPSPGPRPRQPGPAKAARCRLPQRRDRAAAAARAGGLRQPRAASAWGAVKMLVKCWSNAVQTQRVGRSPREVRRRPAHTRGSTC
jgi:hypothetical protein